MKAVKTILYIVNHRPNRSPGQRFRFEQYLPALKNNGFEYDISYIISKKDDKYLYSKGYFFKKTIIFLKMYFLRYKNLLKIKKYDIVFIYREAILTGSNYFEKRFKKLGAKIILDFDDAIWLMDTSIENKKYEWLKNPNKTIDNIRLSDCVIVGNNYLANFSRKYNDNVVVVPTTIDTNYHVPCQKKTKNRICIGWTGSLTTIKHFDYVTPTLLQLKEKYGNKIFFKVIGDGEYVNEPLNLTITPWSLRTEIEDLQEISIGIMPLYDEKWEKGKCGFKGLQYMALEIPTIMSPVGVNTEIIQDGENGFLADKEDEWLEKLSLLIESEELRNTIGKAGRKTIVEKYSVEANKKKYVEVFKSLV